MAYIPYRSLHRMVLLLVSMTSPLALSGCSGDDDGSRDDPSAADEDSKVPEDSEGDAASVKPSARADGGQDASRNDAAKPSSDAGADASGPKPTEAGAPIRDGSMTSQGGPAACTGKPGNKKGKSTSMVSAGGVMRQFIVHRPENLDPNEPAPIVIVPHGYTQSGEEMYRITEYWKLGESEGFVTLFPEGASPTGPWNVGMPTCSSTFGILPLGAGDDQTFLDEMVKAVEADQCVDREHVFVAGFSMGGYFANETGCKSDLVRAIAPHSGGSYDLASCTGKRKPVLLFHGSADQLIPHNCGKEARSRWVQRNGCSSEVETKTIENGSCEYHKDCEDGGQVAFCTLTNMNHGWAGGAAMQVALYPDDYPKFESATKLSWEFFKTYAW
jgi:polyhydroxybutyrate depolymerase